MLIGDKVHARQRFDIISPHAHCSPPGRFSYELCLTDEETEAAGLLKVTVTAKDFKSVWAASRALHSYLGCYGVYIQLEN